MPGPARHADGPPPGSRPRVALTFDVERAGDAPTDVTGQILATLADAGVPAACFLEGRWAAAEPRLARRIAEAGHLVGNHSDRHARLTRLATNALRDDVRAAEAAIRDATGAAVRPWFRCPYGAGARSPRVLGALSELGYRHVPWSVDGRDWAGLPAAELERRVVRLARRAGDGAVVLLHGWPPATAEALPGIVAGLRAGGAELVRLDVLADERP